MARIDLLDRIGVLLDEALHAPDGAAGARDIVAGAQQHLETALLGHDGERNRQRGALDVVVDHGGDALGLALERDHLVVLAGVHVEEAVQHRLRLVVIGAAGPAETQRLAFEVFRLGDVLPRGDGPLRFERLADDVLDLGAAQRRLRAARRDRRAVEIARQHGGHLGAGLQFDQRHVEPFGFEEALVERDIGRHVEAVAADHLADGDFGLRVGARRPGLTRARCRRDGCGAGERHSGHWHEDPPSLF